MDIIIRKMTESDIPDIERLEQICFTADAWSGESFLYRIENEDVFRSFVAECGGEFCGYITVSSQFEEMYIDSVAIAPEFRRKGIARMLINNAVEECRPERTLLEVRVSNAPARALYKSLGFHEIAIRKRYYDDPVEDAIVMEKTTCRV